MKNIWIVANWKSNKNNDGTIAWVETVGPHLTADPKMKVAVCPQFPQISILKEFLLTKSYSLMVGAQNISPFTQGSYTGEVNAENLKNEVSLSIIGHSERRQYFNETDKIVEEKVKRVLENDIIPLVCVQDASTPVPEGCKLIAYEPVFAIGTGKPDTPENANQVAQKLKEKYGQDIEVLYGGSVTSDNCREFISQENISGLLIGRASLDSEEFLKIVKNCSFDES